MSIRVNPNVLPDLLAGLQQVQQQLNQSDLQLASGRSINEPSDNPSGTAALVLNHAAQDQTDSFQQNVSNLQSTLQIADSALASGVSAINQAVALATQAGNSSLNDTDRQAIAQQLTGIQQQLVGIANTTSGGTYLFAGTQVETQPFTLDASSAAGVTYNGNNAVTSVEIASGQNVNINVPGSQIFLNSSGSVFGTLQQLITAVQNNSGISAAATALGQAASQFSTQRVSYDTALNQLSTTGDFLSSQQVQLSTQESDIDSADTAQTVTDFSQEQTAYTTLLEAEGRILNLPNLLDVLQ